MADVPRTDAPKGMEAYDLKGEKDLGALSEEQQAKLNQFKIKTRIADDKYFRSHPEIHCLMSGFLSDALAKKPDNIRNFAADYFTNPDLPNILQKELEERQQLMKQNIVLKKMT